LATASNSNKTISVLFVEDDGVILEVLVSVLAAQFPEVVFYTAVNGGLGLDLFKEHTPDIVITDINMPVLSGVQMCTSIRAVKPGTKFIAITGGPGPFVLHGSEENNFIFDHIIEKPLALQDLFTVVGQFIGEVATAKKQAWQEETGLRLII